MHWLAYGMALVLAVAIIAIGALYLVRPRSATSSFGLPLPEDGPNVAWWLRLKGVRDIASGLIVLALMASGFPRVVGIAADIGAIESPGVDTDTIFADGFEPL